MTVRARFKSWLIRVADYIHAMAGVCPLCSSDLTDLLDEGLVWKTCPVCDYRRVIDEIDYTKLCDYARGCPYGNCDKTHQAVCEILADDLVDVGQ